MYEHWQPDYCRNYSHPWAQTTGAFQSDTPYPHQSNSSVNIGMRSGWPSDDEQRSFISSQMQDSDIEEVPPLPPPLEVSLLYRNDKKDGLEDVDCDKLCQKISSQELIGTPKQQLKKVPSQEFSDAPKQHKKNVTRVYPITEVFNSRFLSDRLADSVSRPNFARILAEKFFSEDVRISSNVSGQRGKKKLDEDIISAIKVASLRMWPLKATENECVAWQQCVKALDEYGRRLRCKHGLSDKDSDKEN